MKKLSKKALKEHKENIAGKIDNEGLAYWLTDYFEPDEIIEDDVRDACIKAAEYLNLADELLEKHGYRL